MIFLSVGYAGSAGNHYGRDRLALSLCRNLGLPVTKRSNIDLHRARKRQRDFQRGPASASKASKLRQRDSRSPHRPGAPDLAILYGYQTVREALASPRRQILAVYATPAAAQRLESLLVARQLTPTIVTAEEISARLPRDAVHQGVLIEARQLEAIDLSELVSEGMVLVLDQVTDPHNVGAIIRTGAAFGVRAIVTTERHSPDFVGVLAKSASGGLEHVALISVANLARALTELGRIGFLRIGLDSEAQADVAEVSLSPPLALVLGSEGRGLRRLTREKCDILARIDVPGAIKSLNVSNACAVALSILLMRLNCDR
jgi:23S rRNA (guanosine2251-2'-O)-methyltransferase